MPPDMVAPQMQRPKVNGILRSLAMLCTVYLTGVVLAMLLGTSIGITEIADWLRHTAIAAAVFAGVFNLIVLAVYDNV